MRILVTGGAGFIGSNLALELEKRGHSVVVLDNFLTGNRQNLEGFKGDIVKGDEKNLEKMNKKFDALFHLAAITDTTMTDKQKMFENNVEGFKHVLDFVEKNNGTLVYASSAAVYGATTETMHEDEALKPLNVYGESKGEMDKIAKKRFKKGTLVGLRYFNVFGPREHFKGKMASMIYQLAMQMKSGERPRIFKYGEQERDHIYVKDVVQANIKALSYHGFGIFNVGTGIKTSFNQLIKYLNKELGTNYEPEYFDNPHRGSYQNITLADISKTKKELGFKPQYNVEKGINEYIQWLDSIRWYRE